MVRGTLKLAPYVQRLLGNPILSPITKAGLWYADAAKAYPFFTGFVTTGVKTSAADLFAQKVIERKEEIDWKRQFTFTAFGFFYLGGIQYGMYNNLFPRMCVPIKRYSKEWGRSLSVGAQVFVDQAIHHPFMYFPCFFLLKGFVLGEENIVDYAVNKYKTEISDSVKALWMVWVPGQIVNFGLVPMHFRIPFAAGISFGWTVILSVMQGVFDKTRSVATTAEEVKQIEDVSKAA
mmetsp:Transcript_11229/g.19179  ORF Transcript_11229/g.19179 Transcript_11229/m.19179 type:complete len:234 (-) Transcript_11229:994-1695(-)|eukprot:CAMPEP_0198210656 /NCGR_PEP_ID=MMETSP1445-20131203/21419_1 /TAXON_ID=36898 /ORGANISM="Pyramimonas sp., Strain CCMP2087" /LENGTH=233 /DNA_ID=CAMNT_0043884775 /DNA_START=127 /DNA_END=828 /DNA_ORIENTATION=+